MPRRTLTDDERRAKKAALNRAWIAKNRDRYNAAKYHYRDRTKLEVLTHYSGGKPHCQHCKTDIIDVLVIDHIKDDGSSHRLALRIPSRGSDATGMQTYEALKREGLPAGLQVLCHNCNVLKERSRLRKARMANPWYKPQWKIPYEH